LDIEEDGEMDVILHVGNCPTVQLTIVSTIHFTLSMAASILVGV